MSTLQEKLDRLKDRVEGGISAQFLKIMHKATRDLEASGISERVLRAGAKAPEFELEDQHGQARSSSELLANGPVLITFYRGFW